MNYPDSSKQLALKLCQQAEQLMHQGQWKLAITLCQQALKQDMNCARADKILGVIYQAKNQLTIAQHWYQTALEKQPHFTEVYANLGNLYSQQQNWTAAIEAYQTAIQLNPNLAGVYRNLSKIWKRLNQPEAALHNLNQTLQLQSNFALENDYIEIGDLFAQHQQWQKALNCYQQAIELNPQFFKSYHKFAGVLSQLQRWQEAILAYQTAIQLNPNFCWSYYHLGRIYQNLEQWEKAIDCFEILIQLQPEMTQFSQELGRLYMKVEEWEKAVIVFEKLIKFDSVAPQVYIALTQALIQLEHWQDAVQIYRQILQLGFQSQLDFSLLIQLGKACHQVKEFAEAISCYQQAITQQPHQSWLHALLGEAFQNHQQSKAAIEAYHQAIKLGLNSSWIFTHLGDLYTQLNQFQSATIAYQKACYQIVLEDYPEFAAHPTLLKSCDFPDFLIIGSSKCGTTSLYQNMVEHPQVLPALKKEIKFWHDDLKQGLDWYRAHFLPCPQTQNYLTGEASPNYLDLQETAQRVFRFCPQMKLIVILRNPVERAISHYYHWVRLGLEHRSLDAVIQAELKTINQVLQFPIQYQRWYQSINYIARGVYIGFIQQWMAFFLPEQFLILSCENLAAHPATIMKQVFTFLGLPDYPVVRYTQLNVGDYPPLSSNLSQALYEFYQPYNQQLEDYLGIKFSWNPVKSTLIKNP